MRFSFVILFPNTIYCLPQKFTITTTTKREKNPKKWSCKQEEKLIKTSLLSYSITTVISINISTTNNMTEGDAIEIDIPGDYYDVQENKFSFPTVFFFVYMSVSRVNNNDIPALFLHMAGFFSIHVCWYMFSRKLVLLNYSGNHILF